MKKIELIAVGSDPEVFIKDHENNLRASFEFISGTKDSAFYFNEHVSVLCDNVMVEYTTTPSVSKEDFIRNNFEAQSLVKELLPENISFIKDVFVEIDDKMMQNPIAQEFGCSPDFNAYTKGKNTPPKASERGRSAGGHVHVSWKNPTKEQQYTLIKALDLYLGLPAMFLDKDVRRKQLYGKAGCFRPKPYGAEYRVLSSFWIHDPELLGFVYDSVIRAIDYVNAGNLLSDVEMDVIRQCIDNNDIVTASMLTKKYDITCVKMTEEVS